MEAKKVKDIMLALSEYAVVSPETTLFEAVMALDNAQKRLQPGRQPHRAVLVVDDDCNVVGKLGHQGFLKALEPKYDKLEHLTGLSQAGINEEFISSMMEDLRFWQSGLRDISHRARTVKMKEVMRPVTESIDEDAPLSEAIHMLIMCGTLSILVTRDSTVVGILRLSDVFDEAVKVISDAV
jgi:CBS domain-containing protein